MDQVFPKVGKERWPELSLRKGDSFPLAREKMTSAEVFNNYFDLLKLLEEATKEKGGRGRKGKEEERERGKKKAKEEKKKDSAVLKYWLEELFNMEAPTL